MNNKTLWIVIGALIVIGLVAYFAAEKKEYSTNSTTQEQGATANTENPTSTPSSTTSSAPAKLSYDKAVNLYGSRRIQITESCVLVPSSIVVKNGSGMMFDNRTAKSVTIALDGIRYTIPAHDFITRTLSYRPLPHDMIVDCSSGRNNGKIRLE